MDSKKKKIKRFNKEIFYKTFTKNNNGIKEQPQKLFSLTLGGSSGQAHPNNLMAHLMYLGADER